MKILRTVAVAAIVALVLFLTNPPLERHRSVVDLTSKVTSYDVDRMVHQGVPLHAIPPAGSNIEEPMIYQNYRLFSTTTDSLGGRISLGVLGMVFDLRPGQFRKSK